jgi:hypothetical protein
VQIERVHRKEHPLGDSAGDHRGIHSRNWPALLHGIIQARQMKARQMKARQMKARQMNL